MESPLIQSTGKNFDRLFDWSTAPSGQHLLENPRILHLSPEKYLKYFEPDLRYCYDA